MKRNIFIVALLLLAFAVLGGYRQFSFGTEPVHIVREVPSSEIRSIQIHSDDVNVEIVRGGADQITASLTGKASPKYIENVKLEAVAKDDRLTIRTEVPELWFSGINILKVDLTIELPARLYDSVNLAIGSGNASVTEVEAGSIAIATGSGNLKFSDLSADEIAIDTGSGNISGERFEANSLSAAARSGNVKLADGTAKLRAETGSGNIRLELESLQRDADVKTGSGNVTILLDKEPDSLRFDFSTRSGNSSVAWPYATQGQTDDGDVKGTFGSGETKLTVRTGSGNIKLEQR